RAGQHGGNRPLEFDWLFGAQAPPTKNQGRLLAQVKTKADREPSSPQGGQLLCCSNWARSGQEAERTVKSSLGRPSIRTRCEPRTARGPLAVRCAVKM